ncbi:hypothetical protein [Acutalibacter caecimuris]|uniref:hypothetical protein n=1 Tax=Acutalibacter caecimuris TaxID=3093657 RepID=UPI002AC9181C|nr:hypothetical protein [Acutalibacter sp. M00118]
MKKAVNILVLTLAVLAMLALGACGQEAAPKAEETLYPVSLDGTEVRVGETTLQALLDKGLEVTVSDENYEQIVVDPTQMLEANAYYSGGSVWISDSVFAHISFVTEEEAVPMGEAVIARLEFSMALEEDPNVLGAIAFDGTPVTEWTRELAGERFPDWTGDENMWLKYGLEYSYDLNFTPEGKLMKFAVERKYDVDWTGED